MIGDVVALRDEIAWFDRRPLSAGESWSRARASQAAPLSDRLAAAGAEVIEVPATRIEPLDPAPLRAAIARLNDFTLGRVHEPNAVRFFWDELRAAGLDARALAGAEACVASAPPRPTRCSRAASRWMSRRIASSPRRLLDALRGARDVSGARVLYATPKARARRCSADSRSSARPSSESTSTDRSLDGAGAAQLKERMSDDGVDLVTFTSASSVTNFVDAVGGTPVRQAPAASIGPVTSQAARAAGLDVVVEATESTIPGLVDAVVDHFAGVSRGRPLMTERTGARLVIATRASELALRQARQVQQALEARGVASELKTYRTPATNISTSRSRPSAARALHQGARNGSREGQGSLCVHSLKDLPTESPPGLRWSRCCREKIRATRSS